MKPLHLNCDEMHAAIDRLGMTIAEFCEASEISVAMYADLLTSQGGQNKLLAYLDTIAAQTLTIGDLVNALVDAGVKSVNINGRYINAYDDAQQLFSCKLPTGYTERQNALRELIGAYE